MRYLNRKIFGVFGVLIIILILATIRIEIDLTHKTINKSLNKLKSIYEFKPKKNSIYLLLVPEDIQSNSILINLRYTRFGGLKPYQSIDLGAFYDNIIQDNKNIYKSNIIDSNNLSTPLSFICGRRLNGRIANLRSVDGGLHFDESVEYTLDDIEKAQVFTTEDYESQFGSTFGIDDDVEYILIDMVRGSEGDELNLSYHFNFEPVFVIDEVKYNVEDILFTYCYVRGTNLSI